MAKTNLDAIVNYPYEVQLKLSQSQKIVGLISNNQNIDINSEEAEKAVEDNIFDYGYVEGVVQESKAFICVDTDVNASSPTINSMVLTVLIGVTKGYMKLSEFKGVKGNRCNNLVREIDLILRESLDFGIGGLELKNVQQVSVNKDFYCKLITYKVPDFARGKIT